MKTLLVAASAIGLLASTPAFAAESQVDITGTVTKACGVGNHHAGGDSNAGWDQSDIVIPNLVDGNGELDSSQTTINNRSFGNIWCNAPATITLEVGSLAVDGDRNAAPPADASSFTNNFDLKITGNFGGHAFSNDPSTLALDTSAEADGVADLTKSTTGAFETGSGQYSGFNVQILNPGNQRPVAGTYKGYVKVTATTV